MWQGHGILGLSDADWMVRVCSFLVLCACVALLWTVTWATTQPRASESKKAREREEKSPFNLKVLKD